MALLYKLPLGASILDQFVSELEGEEHALLILPNRYQMEKVQFSGVPCTGIDTLANRILNENGFLAFEQINRRTQELVVEDLINLMVEGGKFTYFANLTDKEGFLKSITSFIGQLARTGLTTEEIVAHFKLWQEETKRTELEVVKDTEVLMLYRAYRNYIKDKNWYDLEGKYRLAVHLLKQPDTIIPWAKIRVFGFYTLDKLQVDLFRELAKHVDLSIAMYYGEEQVFLACRNTYNSLLGFCEERTSDWNREATPGSVLAANFLSDTNPLERSSKLSTNGIRLVRFTSHDKELRYSLTEIKKLLLSGVAAKDIVLVVRNLDKFTGLGAISEEYGIPISLGKSCKLSNHNLFTFVKLLYQAASETHDGAENYFKLLNLLAKEEFGSLTLELKKDCYFTSSSQARTKLAEVYQKENPYLEATNLFVAAMNQTAPIESFVGTLKAYFKALSLQEVYGNAYKEEKISLEGLKSLFEALKTLDNCLNLVLEDYKLCGREKEKVHPLRWLEILTEAANNVTVNLAYGRVDGIRVMEAANMQGLTYKHVYLLGLRRDEFPMAKNESWIYNDLERDGLNMDLETTYASYKEDAYFFAATLASALEKITISYYEEEAGEKSSYVDELQRIFLNKIDDKFISNLQIENIDEKDIASPGELFEKHGMHIPMNIAQTYLDFDSFILAMSCADMVKHNKVPRFGGKMEDANIISSLKEAIGSVFSASALNTYLGCPYAFLLERVLKLGDGSVCEEEGTPANKGTIIHNTLSGFINNHLQTKLNIAEFYDLQTELKEIFDDVWQQEIKKGKVHDSELWQAEKPRIFTILSNWLLDEIKNQQKWAYKPMATELKFFGGKTKPTVKLELEDGYKVELQGAIDRVDSDGEKLFITDYKLSNSSVPTSTSMLAGEDLQMNIYMLAADNFFDESISGGGYYVMNGLSRKRNLLFEENGLVKKDRHSSSFASFEEFKAAAKAFIIQLIENIYACDFTPSGNNCDYCPYKDICRINADAVKEDCDNA